MSENSVWNISGYCCCYFYSSRLFGVRVDVFAPRRHAVLPDRAGKCVGQFQGRRRIECQGLPSRHTTETSSPGTQQTEEKAQDINIEISGQGKN